MLKNYLKVALRNLLRYKGYTVINVLGLAIGMTACLLILYFVNYEKSYDRFHEKSDRIYRLRYERADQKGEAVRFASCCPPAGLRIRQNFPEVEKVARLFRYKASVSHIENKFIEERMYFAEPDFFEIFNYRFIEGDPVNGLKDPNAAFISETTARKYFGTENPMGKMLSVDKKTNYRITGVFRDIPANSHLKYIFVDESWEDYQYWQRTNKKILEKINDLIKDIARNPYDGLGKPEPLKYKYKGYWPRRIDSEHRLIYRVKDDEIHIAKCRFHYDS